MSGCVSSPRSSRIGDRAMPAAALRKSAATCLGSHLTVCGTLVPSAGASQGLADVLGQVVQRDLHGGAGGAVGQLRGPAGQAALAHGDPERDADQFGVGELYADPDRAVVDDD